MTALDLWLLICLLFVALAMFEYAVMLGAGFRKELQRKIDRLALVMFMALYALTILIYSLFIVIN